MGVGDGSPTLTAVGAGSGPTALKALAHARRGPRRRPTRQATCGPGLMRVTARISGGGLVRSEHGPVHRTSTRSPLRGCSGQLPGVRWSVLPLHTLLLAGAAVLYQWCRGGQGQLVGWWVVERGNLASDARRGVGVLLRDGVAHV